MIAAMTDPRYPIGLFTPPPAFTPALRQEYLDQVAAVPARLRAAVDGLTASYLDHPYRDEGWTLAQVVHHVADSHINAYVRFKLAVTEDNPPVKAYNEALWAGLADASATDVRGSLDLLASLHGRWVTFLRSLDDEQFSRTYNHSAMGPVTLDHALALYAWHGRHHTAHITALRERMGW
ncbi:MAG: DinB-like domain protein [Acidobacteria bacterium]|nr:DinB-like domain protein [Acidobacteriota bacterium]